MLQTDLFLCMELCNNFYNVDNNISNSMNQGIRTFTDGLPCLVNEKSSPNICNGVSLLPDKFGSKIWEKKGFSEVIRGYCTKAESRTLSSLPPPQFFPNGTSVCSSICPHRCCLRPGLVPPTWPAASAPSLFSLTPPVQPPHGYQGDLLKC